MADNHDTLIREVKAELERERFENLWKKYGTYFIAAAAALVIGVGAYQSWQASQRAAQQKTGAAYDTALALAAEKKYDDAAKAFAEVAADSSGGYKVLSQLQLAATYLDQKRTDDAIAAFDRAANSGGDAIYTDFAKLQAAALKLGTADFTEIENRLNGLISDQNPWRFNAREILALAQLKAGRTAAARETVDAIVRDPSAPQDMRQRVQILLDQILAAEAVKDGTKNAAEAPVKDETASGSPKPDQPAEGGSSGVKPAAGSAAPDAKTSEAGTDGAANPAPAEAGK